MLAGAGRAGPAIGPWTHCVYSSWEPELRIVTPRPLAQTNEEMGSILSIMSAVLGQALMLADSDMGKYRDFSSVLICNICSDTLIQLVMAFINAGVLLVAAIMMGPTIWKRIQLGYR